MSKWDGYKHKHEKATKKHKRNRRRLVESHLVLQQIKFENTLCLLKEKNIELRNGKENK